MLCCTACRGVPGRDLGLLYHSYVPIERLQRHFWRFGRFLPPFWGRKCSTGNIFPDFFDFWVMQMFHGEHFLSGRLCRPMARSAMQKATRSVVSLIGRPRTAANGWGRNFVFWQTAVCRRGVPFLFLASWGTAFSRLVLPFVTKRKRKVPPFRCGGRRPGLRPRTPRCGHLTTAYSPAWGPVNKENDFNTISRKVMLSGKKQYFTTRLFKSLPCSGPPGPE